MAIQEGDKIPEATVHHMTDAGPTPITTSELFSGKRSVLFAVPGAFTPGCSMHHLPGFIDNSDEILGKGVDQIVCLSVNDPFVMDAWIKSYSNSKINYVADSNSELLNSSGLEMDLSVIGLGKRLSRFAMFIDNGLIKMIFDEKGGGLEKSKAENVLENL